MANTFIARFDSYCFGCADDIDEGDLVGFIAGEKGIHCAECVEEAEWDITVWNTDTGMDL